MMNTRRHKLQTLGSQAQWQQVCGWLDKSEPVTVVDEQIHIGVTENGAVTLMDLDKGVVLKLAVNKAAVTGADTKEKRLIAVIDVIDGVMTSDYSIRELFNFFQELKTANFNSLSVH